MGYCVCILMFFSMIFSCILGIIYHSHTSIAVFKARGVHCTTHVRVYVSAHEGY